MSEKRDYQSLLNGALLRVPEGYDKREGSVIHTTLAPVCFELSRSYWLLTWLMNLFLPDTAQEEWLDRCVCQFGVERKKAVKATRVIKAYDTSGNALSLTLGDRFRINDLTLTIKEQISVGTYCAEAEIAGIIGNQYQGDLLPIQNINNLGRAELTDILLEGSDEEADDPLRNRFYDHVRRSPFGGNAADYEEKVMSIEGVGSIKVFPIWNGPGTVLLMIGNEEGRTASDELVKKVQDVFQPLSNPETGMAPIGHVVKVMTSESLTINVSADLKIKPGENFSIIKEKVKFEIESYLQSLSFNEPTIFQSRITVAILNVFGVLDTFNVKINGNSANLVLSKDSDKYQVPDIGSIELQEAVG